METRFIRRFLGLFVLPVMLIGAALILSKGNEHSQQQQLPYTFTGQIQADTSPYLRPKRQERTVADAEFEFNRTKDPALNDVPRHRLIEAYRYAEQKRTATIARSSVEIPGIEWQERGPDNVPGRTRAILIDPGDPTGRTVFAAGVSGGLWRTTDITLSTPVWEPINDFFDNLAITALVANPNDPDTLYFGTGEGYFISNAVRGDGIWRSVDGGDTWSQLTATAANDDFGHVQKMVIHPTTGDIFAATRHSANFADLGGVMRSQDGGDTWSKVLSETITISGFSWAADIALAANGDLYAAIGIIFSEGIYKSTDSGDNWSLVYTSSAAEERIELGTAPSDANYVYALVQDTSFAINKIMRTTDGGNSWNTLTLPTWVDNCEVNLNNDFTRGQAFFDLAVAVDPNNRDNVTIGGIDLHKSNNGGSTWTQISSWAACPGFQLVHADQHAIVYQEGNSDVMLFGNDGGVYRTANGSAAVPDIDNKGQGLITTQFYSAAIHPTAGNNYFLAGAQDNGTQRFESAGLNSTVDVTGGDGTIVHIDQDQPDFQFAQYPGINFSRSVDGGQNFAFIGGFAGGQFVNPSDYDDDANVMYISYLPEQYLIWNDPQTGTSFSSVSFVGSLFGAFFSAVTVSPNTANRVFMGTTGGNILQIDAANTAPSAVAINNGSGMPAATVSCIEVEDGNDEHILVTFSNYGVSSVWETTDAGITWSEVEGNLPDIPVRWALFNPDNTDQAMIATELGVWSTDNLDGASTDWSPSVTGMANVRTDQLAMRTSDNVVVAGSHGRGLFTSDVFSSVVAADFSANRTVAYIFGDVEFSDGSTAATSWSWDFGDGGSSTLQNPSHTYNAAGIYNVSLTINGSADTETKTGFIQILPNRGTPYLPSDGGDFEESAVEFAAENIAGTGWERGNSSIDGKQGTNSGSFAWVTGVNDANYVSNSEAILYSPNYNFETVGEYTIAFFSRFATETGFDGFRVEYSLNRGTSWNLLGGVAPTWYNFANGVQATSFPFQEPYFSGDESGSWSINSLDISSLGGNNNVAFRFVFRSDFTLDSIGVAIDDFEIQGESNDQILPVELISFTGSAMLDDDAIRLTWRTASEVSNSHWFIERRDGEGQFRTIERIEGQGTTPTATDYEFWDRRVEQGQTYTYRLSDVGYDGQVTFHPELTVFMGEGNGSGLPRSYELAQNFPNPFNPETVVPYALPQASDVTVEIYNLLGQKVRLLVDERQEAGFKKLRWDGRNDQGYAVTSGIYLYRITAVGGDAESRQTFVDSRKMMLLR